MHGTGVDRPFGNVIDLIEMRARQIVLRVGNELVLAPRRTEVMGRAIVPGGMHSAFDRHAHAADGIDGGSFTLRVICVVRSEEHTSELQSLMRISYAVFCLTKKTLPE